MSNAAANPNVSAGPAVQHMGAGSSSAPSTANASRAAPFLPMCAILLPASFPSILTSSPFSPPSYQSHFTRSFRRITGMTPAAFRSTLDRTA